ncbi:MAG: hypothetical protein K2Q25_14575, partial [Mycobacteriaceae bacterium]|nr:hypothetical protein [Mycobacteriaceae bacterium]
DRLAHRGLKAYYQEAYLSANGITAVHVHVPGFERFYMIIGGRTAVVPGQRGIAAAAARLAG